MTKLGSSSYEIIYLDRVVEDDIPALPKAMRDLIRRAIASRLAADPVSLGKPLRYSFVGHRRIRVGDYRIVYRVDEKSHIVTIVIIKHRKDVYKD